jgi:uncharacterized membrane protein YgcG
VVIHRPGRTIHQRSPNKKDANMKKTHLSKAMTFLSLMLVASIASAQANEATTPQEQEHSVSKVRIVRLSQVKGSVQIARASDRVFETAVANLPIVEKNELRTGTGIAEVEFEDNSSMRLAPDTTVEFPVLARSASGTTGSSVRVVRGTVYISLVKAQNKAANEFQLIFGDRKLELSPSTHIRLDIQGTEAKLAVLDGEIRADGDDGTVNIAKKKTATFNLFSEDEPTIAKDVEKTAFDEWDHTAASYHSGVAAMSAFGSPYAYGTSDMAYYGSYMNAGSCGTMWRPYFASAGWDPFANGSWAYYQGAGYSWVSPYPWAWTPYHSGAWSYCPSAGWGWTPGGGWYGVNNATALIAKGTGGNGGRFPRLPPPRSPLPHQPTVVAANTKAEIASKVTSPSSFEFRNDSAGMGVPRGTLGHLDKLSRETVNHGVATTSVHINIPQPGQGGRISTAQTLGASVQRGSAPAAYSSSGHSSSSYSGGGGSSSSSFSSSSSSVSSGRSGVSPSAPSGGTSTGGSHK